MRAEVGAAVSGPVLTVSGVALRVTAAVSAAEAKLLRKGMRAELALAGGGSVLATIKGIARPSTGGDSYAVTLDPAPITAAQAEALRGTNVKVTIAVGSSDGEVLAVPVAALFSDSAGHPRVEVLTADGATRFQTVLVGLTAGGEVEVHPVDAKNAKVPESTATITAGSLVVVGR